jgi:magnesium transporter
MVLSLSGRNGATLAFCFLSDLLGKRVYGRDYGYIGKVVDLVAAPNDRHPEIMGLMLARTNAKRYFPVRYIDLLGMARSKRFLVNEDQSTPSLPAERYFMVRDTLYDKQVVDINGAKVERVNDVRILFRGNEAPYLDSVDVGFTGLTRRLGWEVGLRRLSRVLLRTQLKDELIAWKFVQPLLEVASGPIHVSLRQEEIRRLHPGELADIFEELDRDERISLVQSISAEHAAEALNETDLDVQTSILRDLDTELAADILEEMEPAVAADVIDNLPLEAQQSIMAAMEEEDRAQLEPLVRAEDDTAASLMTVDFLSCPETYTCAQALQMVRRNADDIEFISYIHCLDDQSRLSGVVSLRNLLLAESEMVLSNVMNRRLASLKPDDDWETVANIFFKYHFKALPVLDEEGHVLGTVTFKHSFDELLGYITKLRAKG